MMDEGFVVHYPEERAYGLSALVSEIGSGSLQTDRLRRMAHPLMERLAASSAIPLVCHLAVLTGAEVTYVDRVSGPRAPTTVSSIGVRLPAHLAATGRSSLAALSHEQVRALYPHRDALIRQGRARARPPSPNSTSCWRPHAPAAGRSKRATSRSGYSSVAAAAVDRNGYPVAAIGVTYRSGPDAAATAALGAAVRQTADILTGRLAGR